MEEMDKEKSFLELELEKYDRKIEELKENKKKREQEIKNKLRKERTKRLIKIGSLFEMVYETEEYEEAEKFLMQMRHDLKKTNNEKYKQDGLDKKKETYEDQTVQVRKSIDILTKIEEELKENKNEKGDEE